MNFIEKYVIGIEPESLFLPLCCPYPGIIGLPGTIPPNIRMLGLMSERSLFS